MATRLKQTLPRGFSPESVQAAIDAIPDGFNMSEIVPTSADTVILAVNRVRDYGRLIRQGDAVISLVQVAKDTQGIQLPMGEGDLTFYVRDGVEVPDKDDMLSGEMDYSLFCGLLEANRPRLEAKMLQRYKDEGLLPSTQAKL